MHFTKMHGAGNDFIIINNMDSQLPHAALPAAARGLCARRSSVGADGLMVVEKAAHGGDYAMLFYNSDGSMGEMCGNGARCIARYGYENGLAGETQHIETTAGEVIGRRIDRRRYQVRLNDPTVIDLHRSAEACGRGYDCAYIELGCPGLPHAIVLLEDGADIDTAALRETGRALRHSSVFPKGANVSFVTVTGEDSLRAVTFERGVEDFTLACGTGCGSIVTALTLLGRVSGRNVGISMPGGELSVTLSAEGDGVRDILLTGPTNIVCEGEITDEDLVLE